jgi:hypothetical protein
MTVFVNDIQRPAIVSGRRCHDTARQTDPLAPLKRQLHLSPPRPLPVRQLGIDTLERESRTHSCPLTQIVAPLHKDRVASFGHVRFVIRGLLHGQQVIINCRTTYSLVVSSHGQLRDAALPLDACSPALRSTSLVRWQSTCPSLPVLLDIE